MRFRSLAEVAGPGWNDHSARGSKAASMRTTDEERDAILRHNVAVLLLDHHQSPEQVVAALGISLDFVRRVAADMGLGAACPVCGRPRYVTAKRVLSQTCGSRACVATLSNRPMRGKSRGPRSPETRAKIAAGQRARWARQRTAVTAP